MPRVTQYIRNGDIKKWNALPNKSEFIHNALNGRLKHLEKQLGRLETKMVDDIVNAPKIIKTPQDAKKVIESKGWSGSIPKSYSARKKK